MTFWKNKGVISVISLILKESPSLYSTITMRVFLDVTLIYSIKTIRQQQWIVCAKASSLERKTLSLKESQHSQRFFDHFVFQHYEIKV